MAYFGKEFTFEREENFQEFVDALVADDSAKAFLYVKPSIIVEKNDDSYKMIFKTPDGEREIVFQPEVPFTEVVSPGVEVTTAINVHDDTFIQVQNFGDKGVVAFQREYSDDTLKVTLTSSQCEGSAYRYFKA